MISLAATPVADAGPGTYIHWAFINISVTNAVIILIMVIVFALAILVPFPGASGDGEHRGDHPSERGDS